MVSSSACTTFLCRRVTLSLPSTGAYNDWLEDCLQEAIFQPTPPSQTSAPAEGAGGSVTRRSVIRLSAKLRHLGSLETGLDAAMRQALPPWWTTNPSSLVPWWPRCSSASPCTPTPRSRRHQRDQWERRRRLYRPRRGVPGALVGAAKPRSTRHGKAMSWDNDGRKPESKACSSWVSLLPDCPVFPHNLSISLFLWHFPRACSRGYRERCRCSPTTRGLS